MILVTGIFIVTMLVLTVISAIFAYITWASDEIRSRYAYTQVIIGCFALSLLVWNVGKYFVHKTWIPTAGKAMITSIYDGSGNHVVDVTNVTKVQLDDSTDSYYIYSGNKKISTQYQIINKDVPPMKYDSMFMKDGKPFDIMNSKENISVTRKEVMCNGMQ